MLSEYDSETIESINNMDITEFNNFFLEELKKIKISPSNVYLKYDIENGILSNLQRNEDLSNKIYDQINMIRDFIWITIYKEISYKELKHFLLDIKIWDLRSLKRIINNFIYQFDEKIVADKYKHFDKIMSFLSNKERKCINNYESRTYIFIKEDKIIKFNTCLDDYKYIILQIILCIENDNCDEIFKVHNKEENTNIQYFNDLCTELSLDWDII